MVDTKLPANAPTAKIERPGFWPRVSGGLDFAVKLFLIATFVIGYLEYRAARNSREVTASFDLVKNWEKDGFQEAYRRIGTKIDTIRILFSEDFPGQKDDVISERNFISSKLIELMEADESLESDVTRTFYFFSKAGLCVSENICSGTVLKRFFIDSAADFIYYLRPYAQLQRADGKKSFGFYAEEFGSSE